MQVHAAGAAGVTVRAWLRPCGRHVERAYSDAWWRARFRTFRPPDSGHLYFTLKDGNAQMSRSDVQNSKARLLTFRPMRTGVAVVVGAGSG